MRSALIILAAMAGVAVLAYLGVIGGFLALIGEVVIVFAAAWLFDRGRRLGARDPFLDADRPDFQPQAGVFVRPIPTEAVESPSDRRSPS